MRVDGARAYAPDGSRAWRFAWRARPSQSVRSPAFGTGSRVAIRMTLCVREIAFACACIHCEYDTAQRSYAPPRTPVHVSLHFRRIHYCRVGHYTLNHITSVASVDASLMRPVLGTS